MAYGSYLETGFNSTLDVSPFINSLSILLNGFVKVEFLDAFLFWIYILDFCFLLSFYRSFSFSRSELGTDSTFYESCCCFFIRRVLASPVLDFCPVGWFTRATDWPLVEDEVLGSKRFLARLRIALVVGPDIVLIVIASRPWPRPYGLG